MMKNYSKSTRKKLRQLTGIAHERELAGALQKLHAQFNDWQTQQIDAFELNDHIHHFHQKTSREIWNLYDHRGHEGLLVARALKFGFLTEGEVGDELLVEIGPLIEYWQGGGVGGK